jgi:hypothetical protein
MRIALDTTWPSRQASLLATSAALLGLLLGAAPPAGADTGQTIINRCTHGKSLSGFTQQDYQRALQELPTEVEEYSNCASLIRAAQLAADRGEARGTVATPVSPSEQKSIERVSRVASPPLRIGGKTVDPGVVHANVASALSSLPDSLLAVLAFMLACAFFTAGGALRKLVRHRNHS